MKVLKTVVLEYIFRNKILLKNIQMLCKNEFSDGKILSENTFPTNF